MDTSSEELEEMTYFLPVALHRDNSIKNVSSGKYELSSIGPYNRSNTTNMARDDVVAKYFSQHWQITEITVLLKLGRN